MIFNNFTTDEAIKHTVSDYHKRTKQYQSDLRNAVLDKMQYQNLLTRATHYAVQRLLMAGLTPTEALIKIGRDGDEAKNY